MGFVMDGMLAVAIAAGCVWLWGLRGSVGRDSVAERQAALQDAQARERAAREASLYQKGVRLHCFGCDTSFDGPLTDAGCPQCHLASLVVTEDEYRRGREASAQKERPH